MTDVVQIGAKRAPSSERRPPWLRVKVSRTTTYQEVGELLDGLKLNTVCQEARCPNIWECWGEHRTATLMILGDICTRNCRYCSVTSGRPLPLDPEEPEHVAEAVHRLALRHVVLTSVDRDDLADFGAGHWISTIEAVRRQNPEARIELLTPDFGDDAALLRRVFDARPNVFGYNTETVPRLFARMRPRGSYAGTMQLLSRLDAMRRETGAPMTTKSGLMLGLGETRDEVLAVMDDLREVHCDVLTLGQYLNPTQKHAPIARFYALEEFAELRAEGLRRGFRHVESGPLVRSSYHAHEHVPGEER
ncbi:MAG: lipoyl synthase [Myxococcota bacterium]